MSILQDLLALRMVETEVKTSIPADDNIQNESVIAESHSDMHELVDKWMDANKAYSFEGDRGVRNFNKFVQSLNPDYRDVDSFLADNSGAIEALINWIQDANVSEWSENLENELGTEQE